MFEWALDGRFLIQRVEISIPEAPNSIAVIGADPGGDAFAQHYFDSRGVVARLRDDVRGRRLDAAAGLAGLLGARASGSATPARSARTATRSTGAWEMSHDEGATWEHDFDLVYRRVA